MRSSVCSPKVIMTARLMGMTYSLCVPFRIENPVRDIGGNFLCSLTLRIRDPMGAQISFHAVCLRPSSEIVRGRPVGVHVCWKS